MDRGEYMRIKGEFVTAVEMLATVRSEKDRVQRALQDWASGGVAQKTDQNGADRAHEMIDRLLKLQQDLTLLELAESRHKQALKGVPVPDLV